MTMHATNQVLDIQANAAVEAYEDVTVPAGTFKAFRVHVTNNLGVDEMFWFNPEHGIFVKQVQKRSEKSPFGLGTREAEVKAIAVAK